MTENTSGLEPTGHAVLVEPYDPQMAKTMIFIPEVVKREGQMLDVQARVVEIGPDCWPGETPRAQVGDVVLLARMSGFICKGVRDGKPYRFVNDLDIFARVTWLGENHV